MPEVSFVKPDGTERKVDAPVGGSAMRAAVTGGVSGIVAECGGEASCATCHVYVDHEWLAQTGEVGLDEEDMLEFTESPCQSNSRLSCQIEINEELDGLVLYVPEEQ